MSATGRFLVHNDSKVSQDNSCHPPLERKRRVWEELGGSYYYYTTTTTTTTTATATTTTTNSY